MYKAVEVDFGWFLGVFVGNLDYSSYRIRVMYGESTLVPEVQLKKSTANSKT